jgi:hypothetical protein
VDLRSLVLPAALVAMAVALLKAVLTRHGVGPIEYATVVLLEALLVVTAFRLSRRAIRRS